MALLWMTHIYTGGASANIVILSMDVCEITPSPIVHVSMVRTMRKSVAKSTLVSVLKDYTKNISDSSDLPK